MNHNICSDCKNINTCICDHCVHLDSTRLPTDAVSDEYKKKIEQAGGFIIEE